MNKKIKVAFIASSCSLMALLTGCGVQDGLSKTTLPPLTYHGDGPSLQLPLSAEDSRRHIQVPEGFETVLFAAEPEIVNPIAFSWDERGRLWVLQSMDYPHKLENKVGGDKITICEDTDGDGQADKFTDFATMQSLSTGLTVVDGGVIVAQAPEMVYLRDTDGDDKVDERTVLLSGFGIWDTHAGPSSLRYGTDNQIWGAVGYSGFEGEVGGKSVSLTRGVYRFAPDGSSFDPIGQFNNNTWGLGLSEEFEVFGSTANNNHSVYVGIPLPYYNYLEKLPEWNLSSDNIQGHYDISPVTLRPLQQVDVKGGYTAAAGANFYTARNYPERFWNQMLVAEPTGHLVHLSKIEGDGAGYREVDGGNLFASTDEWTSPVFADTGPDGNVWVADWYNLVIQHNPDKRGDADRIWNDNKGKGNAHINPLRDKGHGRIYIVRHKSGKKVREQSPIISSLSADRPAELLLGLHSDNGFWRTTAQRIIVEAKLTELLPKLFDIVRTSQPDKNGFNGAGMHALWTIQGLGMLNGEHPDANQLVYKALSNPSAGVRRAAIMLLPATAESSQSLVASGVLDDSTLQVRRTALLRAAELPENRNINKAMEEKAAQNIQDKWLATALRIFQREGDAEKLRPSEVKLFAPTAPGSRHRMALHRRETSERLV